MKAITVSSIKVTLRNIITKDEHELIPARGEDSPFSARRDNFPIIINGGDIVSHDGFFVSSSYMHETVRRNDEWFKKLSDLFPDKKELIEEMRTRYKDEFIPPKDSPLRSEEFNPFADLLEEFERNDLRETERKMISGLLLDVSPERLSEVMFFTPADYEIDIKVLDPFNTTLATHKRKFNIGAFLFDVLRRRFNENIRVPTEQIDPT